MTPSDRRALADFEACAVDGAAFDHRAHLRVAWALLVEDPSQAESRIEAGLKRLLAHLGADPQEFHHTLTVAWMRAVGSAMAEGPDAVDFDAFVVAHPALLDGRALEVYYSPEVLASDAARAAYVPPDRSPFPTRRLP